MSGRSASCSALDGHPLLDTHVFLWAAGEPDRLSGEATELLSAREHALWFSAASIWEIASKSGLGRAGFRADAHLLRRGLIDNGDRELAITAPHAAAVAALPAPHKDPFDRVLPAQAEMEGCQLLTVDDMLQQYPGPVRRV